MLPEWLSWTLTLFLIVLGILGTLLPLLPGVFLILIASFIHLFPQISPLHLSFLQFEILLGLFFAAMAVDHFFGFIGAKIGGVSRIGLLMGILGMIVGLFTGPWGILLGPLAGVFLGEVIVAKKTAPKAARATAGYALGSIAGMVFKIVLALLMGTLLIFFLLRNSTQ